jgi:hypothetical protein
MTALRCLTVASAMLALSMSAATACDDYEEEMALAEAMKASKLAQTTEQPSPSSTQATAPSPAEPTSVAAVAAPDPNTSTRNQ